MSDDASSSASPTAPRWQPLEAIERRVLGVLIEKAKTTPENYPMSLNAIRVGSNQKNNRAPLMQLDDDHVEAALETLRRAGAVAEIQGSGRVHKYRHLAYEWLGVDKVELAVMAELLLRGAQTVGELRGRAARMEPIKDLSDLRPVLDSLETKRLVAYLSPAGRGAMVTHALYQEREMDKVRREAAAQPSVEPDEVATQRPVAAFAASPRQVVGERTATQAADAPQLREEIAALRRELSSMRAEFDSALEAMRRDLEELNRQLGN